MICITCGGVSAIDPIAFAAGAASIDPLLPGERAEFLQQHRALISVAYPPTASGDLLLRFPRLFIVAVR